MHESGLAAPLIRDDIREAASRGDRDYASELMVMPRHFLETHPQAYFQTVAQRAQHYSSKRATKTSRLFANRNVYGSWVTAPAISSPQLDGLTFVPIVCTTPPSVLITKAKKSSPSWEQRRSGG